MAITKDNLNLAGEYRVASELFKRNLFATITYGNKEATDIFAIGLNRKAAVIEVKTSESTRFVTGYYQKYRDELIPHPDFWVFCQMGRQCDRFFVLSHEVLGRVQAKRNTGVENLRYEEYAASAAKGVDNVLLSDILAYEDKWEPILLHCGNIVDIQ